MLFIELAAAAVEFLTVSFNSSSNLRKSSVFGPMNRVGSPSSNDSNFTAIRKLVAYNVELNSLYRHFKSFIK